MKAVERNPLPCMDMQGNVQANWFKWRKRFENYIVASELTKKPETIQCATLLHYIGEECFDIFQTFSFSDGEENKIKCVLEKFENYFTPRKNITFVRHKFFTRNQLPHETIDQYVTDLKSKSRDCEFGELAESLIKDRLLCGIVNNELREKLLQEPDLDLEKALNMCRISEISRQQSQNISGKNVLDEDHHVHAVARSIPKKMRSFQNSQIRGSAGTSQRNQGRADDSMVSKRVRQCTKCGRSHPKFKCPAHKQQCNKCRGYNHFQVMCKSKHVNCVTEEISEKYDNLFIDSIMSKNSNTDWTCRLKINNTFLDFKIDTGAQVNCISVYDFEKLKLDKNNLCNNKNKLTSYSGNTINVLGTCYLKCFYNDVSYIIEFYVVDIDNTPPVIGLQTCQALGLLKRVMSIDSESNIVKKYATLFNGIGCLKIKPYHISIDSSIKPVIHAPRKVPLALRDKLKSQLKHLELTNIIKRVHGPTEWVNSLVMVRKPNGSIRICIDPKDLNNAIKREHFQLSTIEEITSKLKGAKFFSTLDASQGFWQVPLDDESSNLCTFNTPFGRYRYLRLPYGISCAPEIFDSIIKQIFDDIEGVDTYIDDILIWGSTLEEHDERLRQAFERIKKYNLKLNKEKCKFRCTELIYLGHKLTRNGIEPDESKISAIVNMQKPNDKKSVEKFLGMITYLGKFIPNLSEITAPLRDLIKKDVCFQWFEVHENCFEKLKSLVKDKPVLQYFNINKPIVITVDASQHGVGAALLQNNLPVAYASRALTATQRNYAQIEKEMFAILFGCERFRQYVYGQRFTIETDHKPLVAIFKKPLNQCPLRLQRMLLRLQLYDFDLVYKQGNELYVADTLSRAFETKNNSNFFNNVIDKELDSHVNLTIMSLNITDRQLLKFQKATEADETLQLVSKYIKTDWPKIVHPQVNLYKKYVNEISCSSGLMFRNNRLIVPKSMQKEMLNKIHYGHLGIEKCKNRARECLFWPNMNNEIENLVKNCHLCNTYRHSNRREPLIPHNIPKYPWETVGVDLFDFNGHMYVLIIDYYSKFVEIEVLKNITSQEVITKLKSIFSRHGIPKKVVTDGGTQFTSREFLYFSNSWNFEHARVSPKYPQSNGMVERHIQTVKRILKKVSEDHQDLYLALLEYRNTPITGLSSPAHMLMGRKLRGILPMKDCLLKPALVKHSHIKNKLKHKQDNQKTYFDRGSKSLSSLDKGQKVYLQNNNKWHRGTVQSKVDNKPRSYTVKLENGSIFERNRRFLNPLVQGNIDEQARMSDVIDNDNSYSSDEFDESFAHPCTYTDTTTASGRYVKPPDRLIL